MREKFIIEVDRGALFDFIKYGVKTPEAGFDLLGRQIVECLLAGDISFLTQ